MDLWKYRKSIVCLLYTSHEKLERYGAIDELEAEMIAPVSYTHLDVYKRQ